MRRIFGFHKIASLFFIALFFTGSILFAQSGTEEKPSPSGVKKGSAVSTVGKERLRAASADRVKMIEKKIAEIKNDLKESEKFAAVDDISKILPPLVIPEKPAYPPKPVLKDTSSSLKIGEFESEEKFKERAAAAKEQDAKDFRFAEIAWRLKVQNIDDEHDKLKTRLEKEYESNKTREKERIKQIKSDIPALRLRTARQIAQLERRIRDEKANLEILIRNSSEDPLTGICTYTQLPFFDRKTMSFHGINITCPELKRTIKSDVYSFISENITLDVHCSSLADAQHFKDLSENGKLFACVVSDIVHIEKLTGFQNDTYATSWSTSYRVSESDLLHQLWLSAIGSEKIPPAWVPKINLSAPGQTALAPSSEGNSGNTAQSDSGSAGKMSSPVRIYFGTATEVFEGIEISIKADFVMRRMAKRKEASLGDTSLQNLTNDNISIPGKETGERRAIIVKGIEYGFRWCPAGKFYMGPSENAHEVTLTQGFWMLETEVTQEMYQSILETNPSVFRNISFPVEFVSWNNCLDFCDRLTVEAGLKKMQFMLPTEAQWEYACRAGTTTVYSFGDSADLLNRYGNYCDASNTSGWSWRDSLHNDGFDKTAPVKSYKPNAWGLYDMHGNVWEWCSSRYGSYKRTPETDPTGPVDGTFRVFRGGSWGIGAKECACASRYAFIAQFRRDDIGFRICLVPSEKKPIDQ
ncbi:MAG: formylglycine-generating enzyme family protein [Planctomycetia bacterium]|nr:formylglycine-generating enzyme family protein [Planctomycetia bacterium]